jgi:hypothetical protein
MSTVHSAIRAYAFNCTYNSNSWIDNPSTLISDIQTVLSGITNFSYTQLKVSNVKDASNSKIEIEILGIIYNSKTKLNASENDNLISDINDSLLTITYLSFTSISICNDVFFEDPTSGWPGQSFQVDNS